MLSRWLVILTLAAALSGCYRTSETQTIKLPPAGTFTVAIAADHKSQARGYQNVTEVPARQGILFIWPHSQRRQLWMAHMRIPVDVAWINHGLVVGVQTLEPCHDKDQKSCTYYPSPSAVDQILEVSAGALGGVKVGTAARAGP